MRPATIKTAGYLVSCVSVALLGIAAYPGAEKAGVLPALFAGMATSIIGMGLRWLSYEVEQRRKKAEAVETQSRSSGARQPAPAAAAILSSALRSPEAS
jgi:hypothetical protein